MVKRFASGGRSVHFGNIQIYALHVNKLGKCKDAKLKSKKAFGWKR